MDQDLASLTISSDEISTSTLLDRLRHTRFTEIASICEDSATALGLPERIMLHRNWLGAGGMHTGEAYAAWYNLGVLYSRQQDHRSAASAYRSALAAKPGLHAAIINLGLSLEALGDADGAQDAWKSGLQPDEERIMLLNQQGRMLENLGRLDEAERMLHRSLITRHDQPDVIQHWVHVRQKMCSWPLFRDAPSSLTEDDLLNGSGPLASLALSDDPSLHTSNAASWIQRKTTETGERLSSTACYDHARIKIGYISSDFCKHAMSYLVAGLFEKHDRSLFEVFGYCSTRDDGSEIRRRILASFDHLRPVRDLDDEQVARLIRVDEIDILIDLNGLTSGSRIQTLRWKPAPIQATYLGFVGPVPLPELDALLCDKSVIPPNLSALYLPQPHPIAGIYQANDSERVISTGLTRQAENLPERSFVFCCFCGHFKITEKMFSAWMSILRKAPDSVLWLVDDNVWSHTSMRQAAGRQGVDPDRLIFAPRCSPELYMARLGIADLFLDTFPYTAGTVASDAIRMRLPIVTLKGRSFASRMAASLLEFYGATGGIAATLEEYVETATAMANSPNLYAVHRLQFDDGRWASTLGNVAAFTASFESSLMTLYESFRLQAAC